MVYIMVIITLETETTYTITTKSYMVQDIDWPAIMKIMRDGPVKYAIRVLEK